jgi:subtilisin family serine protease
VAYKSDIYSYRVFGCEGSTNDELVIDGLLQAYHDGMDVLTLSLGGPGGWTQTVSSRVANNIANQGRVVTVAVGNAG